MSEIIGATQGDLLDLMAKAWDEGKQSDHSPECRFGDGDCICRNPYREAVTCACNANPFPFGPCLKHNPSERPGGDV